MDHPTQTNLRASTKLACQIANVNPDRLNEAIHADQYPCAPKTIPGRARSFLVDDCVALRLFKHNTDCGMNAAAAGKKACQVREFMQTNPEASKVFIIHTPFGPADYLTSKLDVDLKWLPINDKQSVEVIGVEIIDLDWHRVRVVHRIVEADKQRVVGD